MSRLWILPNEDCSTAPDTIIPQVRHRTSKLPSRYACLKLSDYAVLKDFKRYIYSIKDTQREKAP